MDAADKLYAVIVAKLRRGEASDARYEADLLLRTDPDQQRAHVIRGIVLRHAGLWDEAATALKTCIAEFGESGAVLTNLAQVYEHQGRIDLSRPMLRRALTLDPNQNAALMWYSTVCQEELGTDGRHQAFVEIAKEPNSWRAQLWLAREDIKRGDLAAALERYRMAFSLGSDAEALMMVTGDLGSGGYPQQAIDLVAGGYEPAVHGELVGFNLLNCYLDTRNREGGERLAASMLASLGPGTATALAEFTKAFQNL